MHISFVFLFKFVKMCFNKIAFRVVHFNKIHSYQKNGCIPSKTAGTADRFRQSIDKICFVDL